MQRIWIDTDTASDDAVALIMALKAPHIQVEGISIVAGNVPHDACVQNALYTVELCRAQTPVYCGRNRPIMRALEHAVNVHGRDGMGDVDLDLSGRKAAPGNGIDAMIECICATPQQVRLVTLGPLSNIATAILKEPKVAAAVEHCYIMGGSAMAQGNTTPSAEYNMHTDPEAAHVVLESGIPLTMIGWDVCVDTARIRPEHVAEIRAIGTSLATFAMDIQRKVIEFSAKTLGLTGFCLPDPLAMAVAIDPSIADTKDIYVQVVTGDGIARGQTILDAHGIRGRSPNGKVVTHVAPEVFRGMLRALLG